MTFTKTLNQHLTVKIYLLLIFHLDSLFFSLGIYIYIYLYNLIQYILHQYLPPSLSPPLAHYLFFSPYPPPFLLYIFPFFPLHTSSSTHSSIFANSLRLKSSSFWHWNNKSHHFLSAKTCSSP